MKNIIMMAGKIAIGAIQSMDIKKTTVETADGYFIDDIGVTTYRVKFDKTKIAEVFSGSVSAANQVYPFDIVMIDDDDKIIEQIRNVWIFGMDYSFVTEEWIIVERAEMQGEKMMGDIKYH